MRFETGDGDDDDDDYEDNDDGCREDEKMKVLEMEC